MCARECVHACVFVFGLFVWCWVVVVVCFFVGFVVLVFWMVGEFFPVPCSVPGSFNLSCTSLSHKHHQRNEREREKNNNDRSCQIILCIHPLHTVPSESCDLISTGGLHAFSRANWMRIPTASVDSRFDCGEQSHAPRSAHGWSASVATPWRCTAFVVNSTFTYHTYRSFLLYPPPPPLLFIYLFIYLHYRDLFFVINES